ncbi:class I adenylate-forming enzyme family protein [Nocardia sp. 348MFTsu5.1]|uniref:class I adenylate-forming enzyme family protein n=1 Tax=Nocardia sp. 348MFTsu5.1 TaxID=1172185 RepID=UPI00039EA531|nr:class I adenylate-forming enzyme family protein [Nocardia sp. 348MFTsu5.1]
MTLGPATDRLTFSSDYATDPRLAGMFGPDGPFAVEEVLIDGVRVRSFVSIPGSLVDVFAMSQAHQDLVHLVFENDRLTFGDIRAQALSLALRLRSDFGVEQGDRVAIAMRNYPEFVPAFWAAVILGAIVVPLNSWWQGAELHNALEESGAKVVFADAERIERLASVEGGQSALTIVGVRTAGSSHVGDAAYDDLAFGPGLDVTELATAAADDVVAISYTSGTTGRPKGVVITHRGILCSVMNMGFATIRDVMISGNQPSGQPVQSSGIQAAPLFHIGGINGITGAAMGGAKITLLRKWDIDEAMKLAEQESVTSLGGPPTIAREMLEHPDIVKFRPQVTGFSMGAASVPPDLVGLTGEVFGDSVRVYNGYGLTETTSAVVNNIGVEYFEHPDSVGRLNITADLLVEGPSGESLGPGEIGQLCFRSPQNAKGYWNNQAATDESFVDGWFRSGDLGYIDDEGYIYVVDRLKDVVIRGGENIYCAEVEAVLFEHPDVQDVVLIGLPERIMGERACAVIVARPGTQPTPADLREFAGRRLAAFKCPEAFYMTDEIPKTATGKTVKKAVRQHVLDDDQRILATW